MLVWWTSHPVFFEIYSRHSEYDRLCPFCVPLHPTSTSMSMCNTHCQICNHCLSYDILLCSDGCHPCCSCLFVKELTIAGHPLGLFMKLCYGTDCRCPLFSRTQKYVTDFHCSSKVAYRYSNVMNIRIPNGGSVRLFQFPKSSVEFRSKTCWLFGAYAFDIFIFPSIETADLASPANTVHALWVPKHYYFASPRYDCLFFTGPKLCEYLFLELKLRRLLYGSWILS